MQALRAGDAVELSSDLEDTRAAQACACRPCRRLLPRLFRAARVWVILPPYTYLLFFLPGVFTKCSTARMHVPSCTLATHVPHTRAPRYATERPVISVATEPHPMSYTPWWFFAPHACVRGKDRIKHQDHPSAEMHSMNPHHQTSYVCIHATAYAGQSKRAPRATYSATFVVWCFASYGGGFRR